MMNPIHSLLDLSSSPSDSKSNSLTVHIRFLYSYYVDLNLNQFQSDIPYIVFSKYCIRKCYTHNMNILRMQWIRCFSPISESFYAVDI